MRLSPVRKPWCRDTQEDMGLASLAREDQTRGLLGGEMRVVSCPLLTMSSYVR